MMIHEVLESRDAIGRKIIQNIRSYGIPDGSSEQIQRPYNDSARVKYPFPGANYLRLLAAGEEDPRWYRLKELQRFGYRLRQEYPVTELESWTHLSDGMENARVKFEPYVNARYVLDLPPGDAFSRDRGANYDKVVQLLQCAEEKAGNRRFTYPTGKEDMFYRLIHASAYELRRENSIEADRILAAPLMAYLTFKTAGLSWDYEKEPIFSKSWLEELQGSEGPARLFRAMGKASSMLNRLQSQVLAQAKDYCHEGKGEYFKDLRVTLFYSEAAELGKGVHNEHFFPAGTYRQEAAYELLAELLRVDKERWESGLGRHDDRGRTKISLEYGNFQLQEAVINLGRLELANEITVSRAMAERLPMKAREELNDKDGMRLHLFRYDRSLEENSRAVERRADTLRSFLETCADTVQEIRREERRYLREYPERKAAMEKRAPTYLYYFHGLDELSEHRVADQALAVHYNDRFFPGARIGLPGEKGQDYQTGGIIVETKWPVKTKMGQPVYTQQEIADFADLERFSIAYREEGQAFSKNRPVVRGDEAMAYFVGHKLEDAALATVPNHDPALETMVKMEFRFDDQPFYQIRYREGSGDLNHKLPVGLPHLTDAREDQRFQAAVHTWAKYHNENRLDACTILYSKSWVPVLARKNERSLQHLKKKKKQEDTQRTMAMGR